jgi:peptidoglycan-N-acetylglucosamine deacetylase
MVEGGPGSPEEQQERQAAKYRGSYFLEGLRQTRRVALTFDDGPGLRTPDVLRALNKHQVKATFFWRGDSIERHPDIARAALAAGHTLGNHSYSHPRDVVFSAEEAWNTQFRPAQDVFHKTLGIMPALLRPPFGRVDDAGVELLRDKGFTVVLWSLDTKDYKLWSMPDAAARIEQTVLDYMHNEAIVLMHDDGGPREPAVDALDAIIPQLHDLDYAFVTVDELIGKAPYQ